MRIIAGALRGRTYKAEQNAAVRPISGRIKKSLFDILKGALPGAKVLDVFAGTGAVGIEALSRGAEAVVFVEMDRRIADQLTATLSKMGLAAQTKVLQGNALGDLSWLPYRGGIERFDIVFMGPPYKDENKRPLAYSTPALSRVAEAGLLAPGGLLISQHQVREDVQAPAGFERTRRQKYGDTFVDFFKKASA